MNKIGREMKESMYMMDLEEQGSEQSRKDWRDSWMFNYIICAIRKQRNMEV